MGYGVWATQLAEVPFADLYDLPPWTGDEARPAAAQDWYLSGLSAPEPTEIPWTWLAPPMRFREDKPVTFASVTSRGGDDAVASVPADEQTDFTATLDSGNRVDIHNLAHFMLTYYDEYRVRCPQLRFVLNARTQDEQWQILGAGIGTRILVTGVPAAWPRGADNLVIEGIDHSCSSEQRIVEWSTSPVIGEVPGEVGPFFRLGVSKLDGPDLLPW
jgi:hypothetical protein